MKSTILAAALTLLFLATSASSIDDFVKKFPPTNEAPGADIVKEATMMEKLRTDKPAGGLNKEKMLQGFPPTTAEPTVEIQESYMVKGLKSKSHEKPERAAATLQLNTNEKWMCPYNVAQCCWIYETGWYDLSVSYLYYQICCQDFVIDDIKDDWNGPANFSGAYPNYSLESFAATVCHIPNQDYL